MMKFISAVLGGIVAAYAIAIVIGSIIFQNIIFQQGVEALGLNRITLFYYFGTFFACLLLMWAPGAREWKRLIMLFPVAFVVVGSVALMGFMEATVSPAEGTVGKMQASLSELGRGIALGAFWLLPAIVLISYLLMIWEHRKSVDGVTAI